MHKDYAGEQIDVGDVVVYSVSGDGRAPHLKFGEVLEVRPKSIKVQPLDANLKRVQKSDGFYRGTGEFPYSWDPTHERQEFVKTGEVDADPVSIQSIRPQRFYILRKI